VAYLWKQGARDHPFEGVIIKPSPVAVCICILAGTIITVDDGMTDVLLCHGVTGTLAWSVARRAYFAKVVC
jgi:hypothetical protein